MLALTKDLSLETASHTSVHKLNPLKDGDMDSSEILVTSINSFNPTLVWWGF
jgi:hypothetical protein